MRVLQLHAGYRVPAGEDTVVESEARALERGGHEVHQHIVNNPTEIGPTIRTIARSSYNRHAAREVTELAGSFGPDIAHVHNTWFALSPSVVEAAAATAPVVMTIHNYRLGCLGADLFRGDDVCTVCVGRTPLRGVAHGCYRNSRTLSAVAAFEVMTARRRGVLDAHVSVFVAPSRFMADRLIAIGLPADRLVVKPHFVADPGPRIAPPSASREVLCIGRLAPGKGLPTLLRAWERYSSAAEHRGSEPMELVIIGDGPRAPALREWAPRGVRFEGWLDRDVVVARMLAARAFIFPSEWYEPFGMVLLEAMSAGLPIVASNASDARRIADAPVRLVVPAGDDAALAAALDGLDDATVDAVGARNRLRFEQTYTEQVGLRDLERLYDGAMESTR
ncbi:MAG: glycosyltransferase [Ilumatobacteraceae bacterium]